MGKSLQPIFRAALPAVLAAVTASFSTACGDGGNGGEDGDTADDEDAQPEEGVELPDGTEPTDEEAPDADGDPIADVETEDGVEIPDDPAEAGPFASSQTLVEDVTVGEGVLPATADLTIFLPDGSGPFPVVVFTHGFMLGPGNYTSYGQHLASWGFIVVMPQMPGGIMPPSHRELKEYLGKILDWIDGNASDPSGPLLGRADPARLGLSGHSMGGKISLLLCTEDSRPTASFTVDPVDAAGMPLASPVDYPSVTPELMNLITVPIGLVGETVNAASSGGQACAPAEDNFHQYYLHAVSPALEIEVIGANHMSFLDNPDCGLACSVCPAGTDDPAVTRRLTQRAMTAFYLVFLDGRTDYMAYLTGDPMAADEAAGLVLQDSKNGF
jgi:pimeloyl-ACP methyl ester carboxylesterase